jgi:predicted RNase H-like nuclease (RuvC/YqgF family)
VSYNENPEVLHQIWGTPDSLLKKIDHKQIQNTRFVGLLAQEVEEAMKASGYPHFTGIDIPKNEKEVYSLRYVDFMMPMIKAIQEQQKLIESQKQEIANLKTKNENLEAKLAEIEKMKAEIEVIKAQLLLDKPQEARAKR